MHTLRRFKWDIKGSADPRATAKCSMCSAKITVDHNGSTITGSALTTDCKQMPLF